MMNIPSYSSQYNNSNNMNKKKVTIIVGVVIAAIVIIGVMIAAILLGSSDNSINQSINTDNTEDSEVYTPEFEPDGPEIEVDESPILDVPPEVDWEEPPVLTYYNEDADTNSDGHVDKAEWEVWVSEHPEDLNQDMIISDEKSVYESNDEEAKEEYQPTKAEDIKEPTEEELEAINEAGREAAEAAGQGPSGLLSYTDPSSNPDAFKDNQSEGNAGINVE